MANKQTQPRVLYIMGAARSGSTILSILLGSHQDIENLGEVKKWPDHRGLPRDTELKEENLLFWRKVFEHYQNYTGKVNFQEIKKLYDLVENNRMFVLNLFGCVCPKILQQYETHIGTLFRSIGKISGKVLLLDSSKNLCRGIRLYRSREVETVIIYLVRDPRAVVWSFLKKDIEQRPQKPVRTTINYIIVNTAALLFHLISHRERVFLVRYEDLIQNPKAVLNTFQGHTGLDMTNVKKKIRNREIFDTNYMIDGNRIRKERSIQFTPDLMWKEAMGYLMRFGIYLMTLPFNIIFKYRP